MASTPTLRTPLASLLMRTALDPVSDPKHLEGKGRHDRAVGNRNDRHAADDAIPLGYDGKNAMPIRRSVKNGQVPQQMRKVDEVKAWIGADQWRFRSGSADARSELLPRHDNPIAQAQPSTANGIREDGVVARQLAKRLSRCMVKALECLGSDFRRAAIRLRKEHVEADDRATMLDDLRNHLRHHRARPWPLPQSLQAPLVDIDDRNKLLARHTRIHQLIDVEGFQADGFYGTGIPDPQRQQAHEKQEAEDSPGSEMTRLSQQSDHKGRSTG